MKSKDKTPKFRADGTAASFKANFIKPISYLRSPVTSRTGDTKSECCRTVLFSSRYGRLSSDLLASPTVEKLANCTDSKTITAVGLHELVLKTAVWSAAPVVH